MNIRKSDIVNGLFVIAFPFFGIGKYIAQVGNFSLGQIVSVLPLLVILLFYVSDVLQRKQVEIKISPYYYLLLFFSVLCVVSFFMALKNGYPGSNLINMVTMSLAVLVMVHGAIVVQFYNSENSFFSIANLLYWGLSIDILVNLAGYAAGLRNPIHSIEGRINFPFAQGFYSTANTVAVLNLLIIGRLLLTKYNIWFKTFMLGQFTINLYLIAAINSRLSILIFIFTIFLIFSRVIYRQRILFFVSLLTLPILLRSAEFIYTILQLPGFSKLLQRVSYKDVTGFNGRGELWERGLNWFVTLGDGFLLGNGYHGYYTIELINDLEKFWFRSAATMHMHSSMLEYLLSIGLIGVVPFMIILYNVVNFIKHQRLNDHQDGALLGILVYLTFLFQIDNYVYINNFGAMILITIISSFLVKKKNVEPILTP